MNKTSPEYISILYGTETGNSKDLADFLGYELSARKVKYKVIDTEEYDIKDFINEKVVLFIVSTTGDGECPVKFKKLWLSLLRKNLFVGIFEGVRVGIFGLGSKKYKKYNFVAKKLHKRLEELGTEFITKLYLSDESSILGNYYLLGKWLCEVTERLHLPERSVIPEPKLRLVFGHTNEINRDKHSKDTMYVSSLLKHRRLTSPSHFQDVQAINLRLNPQYDKTDGYLVNSPTYPECMARNEVSAGDVMLMYGENEQKDILDLIEIFGWQECALREIGIYEGREDYGSIPSDIRCMLESHMRRHGKVTFMNLLKKYLHISHFTPPQHFFRVLKNCIPNEKLETIYSLKINEFSDLDKPEYVQEYYEYALKPQRRIIEILRELMVWCKDTPPKMNMIDPCYVFDLFPWTKYRQFSITSFKNDSLLLTVAIINNDSNLINISDKKVIKNKRNGFFSSYLKRTIESTDNTSQTFYCRIKKGSMRLPNNPQIPIIMAYTGTGIAPVFCLLEKRLSCGEDIGETLLFGGIRDRNKDFLYGEELVAMEKEKRNNLQMFIACSREGNGRRLYVQDLMREKIDLLKDFIRRGCFIYICGSLGLPKGIEDVFTSISPEENLLEKLRLEKRCYVEVW